MFALAQSLSPTKPAPAGVTVTLVALTSPDSWARIGSGTPTEELPEFRPKLDTNGPLPVGVIATVQHPSPGRPGAVDDSADGRMAVFGDSDFASNFYLNLLGNKDLFMSMIGVLAEEQDADRHAPQGNTRRHVVADLPDGTSRSGDLLDLGHRGTGIHSPSRRYCRLPAPASGEQSVSGRATILLALLALLAGALYVITSGNKPVAPPNSNLLGEPRYIDPSTPVTHLLDFDPAHVTGVDLERDGRALSAHRKGAKWQGVESESRFNDFLVSLKNTAQLTIIDAAPSNLDVYGLTSPERHVVLERSDGLPITLDIGERNPAGTAVYVRVGKGPVSLAGSLLIWEFDKGCAAITGQMPQD